MILLGGILCGCGRSDVQRSQVREYVRLAVALGERDPDALDHYYGPEEYVADVRRNPPALSAIRREADQAARAAHSGFLAAQLRAIAARAALLSGDRLTFDQEARVFFNAGPPWDTSISQDVRRQLSRLPGRGPLSDRYEAFDRRYLVPPERVPDVMARALTACRERTAANASLPPGEKVTLAYVHNKPWSAFSHYRDNYTSVIEVNVDLGLTVDRALDLACHEGYPGHHFFNSRTEQLLVRTNRRPELVAQLTFSPQSFVSEGAATVAPEIAFTDDERIRFERDVLFPLAGLRSDDAERYVRTARLVDALHPVELSIAKRYLDGELEFARAAEALREEALMNQPEATLKYLNEYRSYVVTYTLGHDRIRAWLEKRGVSGKWRALEDLIANPEAVFQP